MKNLTDIFSDVLANPSVEKIHGFEAAFMSSTENQKLDVLTCYLSALLNNAPEEMEATIENIAASQNTDPYSVACSLIIRSTERALLKSNTITQSMAVATVLRKMVGGPSIQLNN